MTLEGLNFEAALALLEGIVSELEGDALSIERSVELYERGIELARYCGEQLDRAELRVNQLLPRGDDYELRPLVVDD